MVGIIGIFNGKERSYNWEILIGIWSFGRQEKEGTGRFGAVTVFNGMMVGTQCSVEKQREWVLYRFRLCSK